MAFQITLRNHKETRDRGAGERADRRRLADAEFDAHRDEDRRLGGAVHRAGSGEFRGRAELSGSRALVAVGGSVEASREPHMIDASRIAARTGDSAPAGVVPVIAAASLAAAMACRVWAPGNTETDGRAAAERFVAEANETIGRLSARGGTNRLGSRAPTSPRIPKRVAARASQATLEARSRFATDAASFDSAPCRRQSNGN